MYKITHDPRGYYTLTIDGVFAGNFDTIEEAASEVNELIHSAVC